MFDGKGVLRAPHGVYKGTFKEGLKHGSGVYKWPNQSRYEGNYDKDFREGYGEYYSSKGVLEFKGMWKKDQPVVKSSSIGQAVPQKSSVLTK